MNLPQSTQTKQSTRPVGYYEHYETRSFAQLIGYLPIKYETISYCPTREDALKRSQLTE